MDVVAQLGLVIWIVVEAPGVAIRIVKGVDGGRVDVQAGGRGEPFAVQVDAVDEAYGDLEVLEVDEKLP
jgi:hypothetical protein